MFVSRGYRGMHIIPYPNHIKEQLDNGLIIPGLKNKMHMYNDDQWFVTQDQSLDVSLITNEFL